jgi:IS4 transposase
VAARRASTKLRRRPPDAAFLNIPYDAQHEEPFLAFLGGILRDELIELTTWDAANKCPFRLRLVEIDDPDQAGTLIVLTNHLLFGATTIAALYKERWQVELFFKALEQNLKIKTFVGTSASDV